MNQSTRHPAAPTGGGMTYSFTGAQFVAAVRELVAEKPDHIYEAPAVRVDGLCVAQCVYAHNGAPSCPIGQALHRLGVPVSELVTLDNTESGSAPAAEALRRLAPNVSTPAREWANEVQCHQDDGAPWGEAVARADVRVPGVEGL